MCDYKYNKTTYNNIVNAGFGFGVGDMIVSFDEKNISGSNGFDFHGLSPELGFDVGLSPVFEMLRLCISSGDGRMVGDLLGDEPEVFLVVDQLVGF